MPAHIEPITWILRAGPDMHQHGDPYTVSAVVQPISPTEMRVMGANDSLYPGFLSDVRILAQELGITRVVWERRKGEKLRVVELIIKEEL
jgi:hypothetical protein